MTPETPPVSPPIIAVCGKGGVGKTALTALLARALIDAGVRPLLLVDADPVGGLTAAIGAGDVPTLGAVRERVIAAARGADDEVRRRLADELDYLVMEALVERDGYALLAMGRSRERGCYCPVNTLLREAIDVIATPFAAVLIDAEAGLEQVNRQVTRRVTRAVVVTDGSARSHATLALLRDALGAERIGVVTGVVANRGAAPPDAGLDGLPVLGALPEDETLRAFDRAGRPLWELPEDAPALVAVRGVARALGLVPGGGSS